MKFSFIIPAYNEEKLIVGCINAIKHCCDGIIDDYEIIVINNLSTDNTVKLALASGAFIRNSAGRTIGQVRNIGAITAVGDYLIFIDADTLVTRRLLYSMLGHINCGKVGGGCLLGLWDGGLIGSILTSLWNIFAKRKSYYHGSFIFVRTLAFRKLLGFDECLCVCEDIEFSNRLNAAYDNCILLSEKVKTSGRKLRLFTFKEHLQFWKSIFFDFNNAIYDRNKCFIHYTNRR